MSAVPEVSQRRSNSEISQQKSSDQISEKSSLLQSLISGYKSNTLPECKTIDAFLLFTIMTGVAQMIYCVMTKGYPYNSFIGVFSASIGSFVFAANARLQMSGKTSLSKVEKIHLIIEFLVCSILLNVFVANFIG